jgi:hypothetical protein
MTMKKTQLMAFLVAAILSVLSNSAVSEDLAIQHLETEDLRLVYLQEEHEYLLPHLGRCFHNSLDFHKELFGYTPNERITVLLQDFDDYGYAGASAIPVNYLTLGIEPFEYVYETSPTNERINWVMSHELLHVVALDQAAPVDNRFRKLFSGKVLPTDEQPLSMLYGYLTTPRRYAPRWYHEGLATFMETWMAGGIGRTLGGYDEMVFRSMVADDDYFYDLVGLVSEGTTADFQVGVVGSSVMSRVNTGQRRWSPGCAAAKTARPHSAVSSSMSSAETWEKSGETGSSGNISGRPPTSSGCRSILSPNSKRSPNALWARSPGPITILIPESSSQR